MKKNVFVMMAVAGVLFASCASKKRTGKLPNGE